VGGRRLQVRSSVAELADQPGSSEHCVQLHHDDAKSLGRNVGAYLARPLRSGGCALIVATPEHTEAICAYLRRRRVDVGRARDGGQLVCLDASETLSRFMVGGYPDPEKFDRVVGNVVRSSLARTAGGQLRAYGEMVGLLWAQGQFPAAIRLEQLWNRLRKAVSFSLYCGYSIDVFGQQFEPRLIDALLSAHTHLLPGAEGDGLKAAVLQAMNEASPRIEESGSGAARGGEALILWLRNQHASQADEVLSRARSYYRAASV
jgi:hypothetical protein